MDYLKLLETSYKCWQECDREISRLEYLSNHIFDFTTYDGEIDELFATKAVEVCRAINDIETFEYQEDVENYRWFLIMVNMPFFCNKLEWGTSIRGAWWIHEDITIDSCGLFDDNCDQILDLKLDRDEWVKFIDAVIIFSEV